VVRRITLAAAVRSGPVRDAIASTQTPRLKTGALQQSPWWILHGRRPADVRIGGLFPNPLVTVGDGTPVRLDTVVRGHPAIVTGGLPAAELVDFCQRHGLLLVRVTAPARAGGAQQPGAAAGGWAGARLVGEPEAPVLQALIRDAALVVLVRPDGVVAATGAAARLPCLPWSIPADSFPSPAG
jgi:hypothetical protein